MVVGPDLFRGFWFKVLMNLHPKLQKLLQGYEHQVIIPEQIVITRTVLVQKHPS